MSQRSEQAASRLIAQATTRLRKATNRLDHASKQHTREQHARTQRHLDQAQADHDAAKVDLERLQALRA